MACTSFGSSDRANISNIEIACGALLAAPRRVEGKDSLVFEPNVNYTQDWHICASGLQASIKTLEFSVNGTSTLADTRVISMVDETYPNNASKPLWAVEKTMFNITDLKPLWGMVDDKYETADSV
jgi:hypothetical protein